MRILHLAFEDHARPGAGGGSLRNREINRRLAAAGHEIEVVTAAFAGCEAREEDGVRYRHAGLPVGYLPSLLAHQAVLPLAARAALRRRAPDVVVEEFAPPWTSLGVGHWTRRPTVGVAQGYFAAEKARQYHLPRRPLLAIERWGTRSHRQLIAVSEELGAQLRRAAPASTVAVVPNGIDHDELARALATPPSRQAEELVYLGRLELDQKGLDLLLETFAVVLARRPRARLSIAGDGKDAGALRARVATLGFSDRVRFLGRVSGEQRWRLLAGASIVLVPSRYETFGLVALEAMACGTPVAAFDIPCLRALFTTGAGVLAPAFDTAALASAVVALLADPAAAARAGAAGRAVGRQHDWDALATAQGAVYAEAIGAPAAIRGAARPLSGSMAA